MVRIGMALGAIAAALAAFAALMPVWDDLPRMIAAAAAAFAAAAAYMHANGGDVSPQPSPPSQ